MVLRNVTGKADAQITFMNIPVPSDSAINDPFGEILSGVLPLFLILIYLLPVYNTVFLIVKEKESRTKESCKMMGMTDLPFWLSWFAYFTIQNTIISLIAWGVLCINVIVYSNKGLILIFFWLFGESIFG
jgi:ATP-binding cassette subfamily A (ABC1) protein 7